MNQINIIMAKCNITEPCERGRNICCAMCDDFEDCSDVCDWINYNFAIKCFQKIELENN